MTNMTEIVTKAAELENDLVQVKKELKRIASMKCRLKKMPGRKTYQEEMTKILQEEQLLKNVRDYLDDPKKNVNTLTLEDISIMGYDEVCKAIRSIQSKKTHTKWAEDCERDENGSYIPGTGDSYKEACRIERMLVARRDEIKPISNNEVRKSDLKELLENLRMCSDLDVETCIERIEQFLDD